MNVTRDFLQEHGKHMLRVFAPVMAMKLTQNSFSLKRFSKPHCKLFHDLNNMYRCNNDRVDSNGRMNLFQFVLCQRSQNRKQGFVCTCGEVRSFIDEGMFEVNYSYMPNECIWQSLTHCERFLRLLMCLFITPAPFITPPLSS